MSSSALRAANNSRPGSGKSTTAYPLTDRLNSLLGHSTHPSHVDSRGDIASPAPEAGVEGEVAICVGLDGWHYSRSELDTFPDPVEAHWLRGAAFTFNLPSYLAFLQSLRLPLSPNPPIGIPFPTFDHALKDPSTSPHPILPRHRIVLIEGLYTMLDRDGWRDCAEMMDMRVWVECDREVCRARTVERNFAAGIVASREECEERVDKSDVVNGDEVAENQYKATMVLRQ